MNKSVLQQIASAYEEYTQKAEHTPIEIASNFSKEMIKFRNNENNVDKLNALVEEISSLNINANNTHLLAVANELNLLAVDNRELSDTKKAIMQKWQMAIVKGLDKK